jgi:S-layer homology domain
MSNPPEHPPRRKRDLDFDEWLAILVAFGVLGPILFWGLRPLGSNLALGDGQPFGFSNPNPTLSPNPGATIAANANESTASPTLQPVPAVGANVSGPNVSGPNAPGLAVGAAAGLGGLAVGAAPSVAAPAAPAPVATPAPIATPIASPTAIPTTAAVPDGSPTPVLDGSASPAPSAAASPTTSPTIAMAAPTAAPTIVASTFKDVPKGTWEAPFVNALGEKKLLSSFAQGEFKPDEPVTRSQFAAMLSQAMTLADDPSGVKAFKDLPATYWANPKIGGAIKAGFMRGYSPSEFRPDQPIPRHQILIALVSGLKLQPPADVPGVMSRYKDSKDVVKYAIDRVATATKASLVVNPTALDQLEPNRPATRGEAAAMIHQALVEQGKFKAIDSSVVVKP